ncbi:glycoside hydrolase family 3 protein [Rhizomonospora bruguierae]|uniref:glycoside hydrolase family 3 protein n=1 Tax=Rhizomonospora bruguierae TaxID=1581705 RepID=UPI0020BDD3B5|nr:glycoside hydrolase family 3 N-terminal domain-containing protein [Micromonospora sp. NBRC 107566]
MGGRTGVARRVGDLLSRMTLPEKAGLLFHPMIAMGPGGRIAPADPDYGLLCAREMIQRWHLNHFNLVNGGSPGELAEWHNRVQDLASGSRLGIPVTLSTDPRHGRSANPNTAVLAGPFSVWPEPLGLAAARDPALVYRFADTVRREYLAVGLRVALHPQVDLATEPRWPRVVGTFGADPALVGALAGPYVRGLQTDVLGPDSVAAMSKHFPGGGPQRDGEDPHFARGREQVYPGGRFDDHLRPFRAAIGAGTSQIMPYYGMPVGTPYERVGFAFNAGVITGLLRGELGFDGIVCTDWGVLTDAAFHGEPRPARAWGVEGLTPLERAGRALAAGCDQFGGEACPELVVDLVRGGALDERRLDASVRRLLREKVTLGLFDRRHVDPAAAERTVGRADFRAAGLAAQRACVTLLRNADVRSAARLPLRPGLRVFSTGVSREVLARYAVVVDRPGDAEVALLRIQAPYERRGGEVESYFHSGSLAYPAGELASVLRIADAVPSIVDVYLDRPAVLTGLIAHAAALLVTFGVSDEALLDVLTGRDAPRGRLPFDLPRSMAAVAAGRPDVPFDDPDPLFGYGHGLGY